MVFGGDEPALTTGTCTNANDDKNNSKRQIMEDVDIAVAGWPWLHWLASAVLFRVCDSRMSMRISLGLALCRRLDLDGLEGTAQHVVPSPRENFAMMKRRI